MMPNDIAQARCDGEGVDARAATHGNRSGWMAHWMHTSCRSSSSNRDHLSVGCKAKEVKEDSDAEQRRSLGGSDVAVDSSSMHAGALGEAGRDTRVTFINEADSGISKKPSFGSKSFPILSLSQKTDGMLYLKRENDSLYHGEVKKSETQSSSGDDSVSLNRIGSVSLNRIGNHLPSTSALAPPKTEASVSECQSLSKGILPTNLLMKSLNAVEQNNLAVSTILCNEFVKKSDSALLPNVRDKGKGLMCPFTSGQNEVYQSGYNLASEEHFTTTKYHSYSSLLIHEKKMSSLLDPQRSSFSRWVKDGVVHLPHDPIAGSDDELYSVCGQHHKIQNYTANANITNPTASLESTKSLKFCGGRSLVPQLPCSVDDIETMKIYTSVDSVEQPSRYHPKISQTTHQFQMSKKTDVNLSGGGQFFRESMAPTKFKGNSFNGICDLTPPVSDHALEGVNLEALGSSRKSEGKENFQDLKSSTSLKNESSAETDTMDIHALHENHLPGYIQLQTKECSKDSQNSPMSQVALTSAREKAKERSMNTTLPDINQEPPEHLLLASPVVEKETSTSRTHSLGVEQLLSHADDHAGSKSGNFSLGPDPSSRWVKRLKLCKLGSAHGTKNAKIGESFSHEKVNNIFTENMEGIEPSSKPKAEEQMVPDLPATVLTNGDSSFTEAKRAVEITLSHPWIQRWSHKCSASFQKSHELVDLHNPKSSGAVLEKFQKKQFPSIAAMAMMGKAMNSLNPSGLMKKGPVMVWDAKGFRNC